MSPRMKVIEVEEDNLFGEDVDESLMYDDGRTASFIEGYSDVRAARERAIVEQRSPGAPLKHRLHFAKVQDASGRHDGSKKVAHHSQRGYDIMSWDDAIAAGYRVDKNAAFRKGEDGNVYYSDTVLMAAPAKAAAANLRRNREALQAQVESTEVKVQEAVDRFNASQPAPTSAVFELETPAETKKSKR